MELFQNTPSARVFNIIDNILVEEALRDKSLEGDLIKTRAILNKEYNKLGGQIDPEAVPEYMEGSEQGFDVGFGPAG